MENLRKKLKTAQETTNAPKQLPTKVDKLQSPSSLDNRIQMLLGYEESIRERDNELNKLRQINNDYKQKLSLNKNRIKQLTYEIEKLREDYSLQMAQINENERIDDSALQSNNSNANKLSEDCLLEIFSYLSLDDMMQITKVCKKWYQASQQWFTQVQTLVYNENRSGEATLELYQRYYKRKMYEEINISKFDKIITILHSCGHHIRYYKVSLYISPSYLSPVPLNDTCKEFLFQYVPKLCKNLVDIEFHGDKAVYSPSTFKIMATSWKKLEKIHFEVVRHPVNANFYDLLWNNQQLKCLKLRYDHDPSCRLNEKLFNHLPGTIEEIELSGVKTSDRKQLKQLISGRKNFPSLKSFKFAYIPHLSDTMLEAIVDIKSITHLCLSHISYKSYASLDLIANMEGLKSLSLISYSPDIPDDHIINIVESCLQLEYLDIHSTVELTDEGLAAIAKMKKLKCLNVNMKKVNNESIINSCESLEAYYTHYSRMDNSDAIKLLKKLTNLRYANFGYCRDVSKDMIHAANLIANDRKKNILCISGYYDRDVDDMDTPYFKHIKRKEDIPLEIFPNDLRNYMKLINS